MNQVDPNDDAWRDLDDTLADGSSPAEVPDAAKPWLGEQRYMHGLLRALHTADAQARESRVARIFAAIDGDPQVLPTRGRWLAVAMAAALLACLGIWFSLPAKLPTAEAAVQRAVAELARDVDRRYVCHVDVGEEGRTAQHTFTLVARSGMRFRIDGRLGFGGTPIAEFRIGCDGEEMWLVSANGFFRRSAPIAERERLMTGLGEVLDLGYLDLHDLVRKLPESFDLRVVGREVDGTGRALLRIAAKPGAAAPTSGHPLARLASAELWCDEATGMIVRIVAEGAARRGPVRRLQVDYQGEEPPGLVDYRRPW